MRVAANAVVAGRGIGHVAALLLAGVALVAPHAAAQETIAERAGASALLAIDQHRPTVIERIVAQWGAPLAASGAGLDGEQLRALLADLRADQLLAASLAGTLDGLRDVVANALPTTPLRGRPLQAKALGDSASDLVYTPINPCRIVDTRGGAGGFLGNNTARDWNTARPGGSFADQGGANNDCGIPGEPAAVLANFAVTGSSQPGVLFASAFNQPPPVASTLNYAGGQTIANAVIVPTAVGLSKELHVFVSTATHVVIDVLGYFQAPGGGGGWYFRRNGNSFGTTALLGTNDNHSLILMTNGVQAMRFEPRAYPNAGNVIGGAGQNAVVSAAWSATIAGGGDSTNDCYEIATDSQDRPCSNRVTSDYGAVGGGSSNVANLFGVVAGGYANTASGILSSIAGGEANRAPGFHSMIPGGYRNQANGDYSFAAGKLARAHASGQFVWADSRSFLFDPSVSWVNSVNTFNVRATGGVWFVSGIDSNGGAVTGCSMQPGVGAWGCSSSRDVKTDFEHVDVVSVLDKVVALPIERWRFKGEAEEARHVGPMAQDFRAAFGLGHDDTTIRSVDADGIALAAIQGLHKVVQQKDARIAAQDARIAALERTLDELARSIEVLHGKR
jgi:hypothetical protein